MMISNHTDSNDYGTSSRLQSFYFWACVTVSFANDTEGVGTNSVSI